MNTQIKSTMIEKIKNLYKSIWPLEFNNPDYYLFWLDNDIGRWLNNDKAMLYGTEPKLRNFIERIPNLTTHEYVYSNHNSSLNVYIEHVNKILNAMTCVELVEFLQFYNDTILNE